MSDWLKLAMMLGGVSVTMYVMQQQHDYRIGALEKAFENHLQKHEYDLESIKQEIQKLRVDVVKIATLNQKHALETQ